MRNTETVDKISDAELAVMQAVWKAEAPVAFTQIRAGLREPWESVTVNTLVNRLVAKGALAREKREVYYYTPMVSEAEFLQSRTRSFVDKLYGGDAKGLLAALVRANEVSAGDLEELRAWFEKEGGGDG